MLPGLVGGVRGVCAAVSSLPRVWCFCLVPVSSVSCSPTGLNLPSVPGAG